MGQRCREVAFAWGPFVGSPGFLTGDHSDNSVLDADREEENGMNILPPDPPLQRIVIASSSGIGDGKGGDSLEKGAKVPGKVAGKWITFDRGSAPPVITSERGEQALGGEGPDTHPCDSQGASSLACQPEK
jgi:hypothetical protein